MVYLMGALLIFIVHRIIVDSRELWRVNQVIELEKQINQNRKINKVK